MTTGTPLDLTPFGSVLQGIGFLYWLLALAGVAFTLWLPKRWWVKLVSAAAVLAAFAYPVVTYVSVRSQQHDEAKARLEAAMARFEMRCKSAGERISRTVDDIDGVVLLKTRTEQNLSDQFKLDDPYGADVTGDAYGLSFLRLTEGASLNIKLAEHYRTGYQFVVSGAPSEGSSRRHHMRLAVTQPGGSPLPELSTETPTGPVPRYGVTYDDLSTHEDREFWIAGSSLKVVDLKTNEVIAERIGYMVDRGQGDQSGFRSPWAYAPYTACPSFPLASSGAPNQFWQTRDFVHKVLKPKQGE